MSDSCSAFQVFQIIKQKETVRDVNHPQLSFFFVKRGLVTLVGDKRVMMLLYFLFFLPHFLNFFPRYTCTKLKLKFRKRTLLG